jgi:hypothetical protein
MKQHKRRKIQSIKSRILSAKKERIKRRSFGWTEILFSVKFGHKPTDVSIKETDKSTKRLDAPKVYLFSKTGPKG